MSTKNKPSRYALDVSRFANTPSYELAVVVHRETEIERRKESESFKAKHGDIPPPTNLLMAHSGQHDWSAYTAWGEYAKNIDVLDRCEAALGVPAGEVAKRIVRELQPENWEVIFWVGAWLQALYEKADAETQRLQMVYEQAQAAEKARQDRRRGGLGKHEKHAKVKDFVLAEWALHKDSWGRNRTDFARAYVRRIKREFDLDLAESTISARWLSKI